MAAAGAAHCPWPTLSRIPLAPCPSSFEAYFCFERRKSIGANVASYFIAAHHTSRRFYQSGASFLFPDAWDKYLEAIPVEEHGDLVTAYHTRLTSSDADVQVRAAKAWSIWEGSTSKLFLDPQFIQKFSGDAFALAFARIESHYFFNRGFFESDGWLLDNIDKIRSVPCVIVQGRYDVVCPMTSAWDLKKVFPEAELVIVPDAGHSAQEPGIISGLVTATNKFRELPH